MNKISGLVGKLTKLWATEGAPRLQVFQKYALVELTPPMKGSEFKDIATDLKACINYVTKKEFMCDTVKDFTLKSLIATEVFCWFWVGECIGKRHIVGYAL